MKNMKPIASTAVSYDELCHYVGMSSRPAFYAGRSVFAGGDLTTRHMEKFYSRIAVLVSNEAASRFVRLINRLEDLTASNFLVEFERFLSRGFVLPEVVKSAKPGELLRGRDKGLEADAMAVVFGFLGGGRQDPEDIKRDSLSLKREFITAHADAIPKEERIDFNARNTVCTMWGGSRYGGEY